MIDKRPEKLNGQGVAWFLSGGRGADFSTLDDESKMEQTACVQDRPFY